MANTGTTTRGLRVGRVFGAPIIVSPFTLVTIAVIAYLRASSDTEGITSGAIGRGVAVAVLLFVAVFLHELAHAASARVFKRRVDEIVLSIMGGHTAIDARGNTPLIAGVTSIAGPVSNLVLGLASLAAASNLPETEATWYIAQFAFLNLLLAVFNALPALPLDGGHVFEAIVWAATGKRRTGTVAAAWIGRVIAIAVPVFVLSAPLRGQPAPSTFTIVWALFIAGIFWPAASAALREAKLQSRLDDLSVATLMRPAIGVASRMSVAAALGEAVAAQAEHVVILADDGVAAGHFPIENAAEIPADRTEGTAVDAIGLALPRGAEVESMVAGAEVLHHIREWWGRTEVLAVVDDGTVVGVLRLGEAVQRLKG